MITDTLALLVLTVIVEMAVGDVDDWFWYRLGAAIILFFAFVMIVFPIVGRWFFKRCEDNVSQYIFVLVMVFLGAYLAELAGLESIIRGFSCGDGVEPSDSFDLSFDEPGGVRGERDLYSFLLDRGWEC